MDLLRLSITLLDKLANLHCCIEETEQGRELKLAFSREELRCVFQ